MRPLPGRRRVLELLSGLGAAGLGAAGLAAGGLTVGMGAGARAQAPQAGAVLPDGVSLLAAGPEGGEMEGWARLLAPALQRALPAAVAVRRGHAGGVDGVTGANQFETSAQPDGSSLLLAPGAAVMAWLAGDRRVHFDAGGWVPLMAGLGPAVLVSRIEPAALRRGAPVRVGVTAPYAPDLAAVLGLELMGLTPVPVPGPPPSVTAAGVVDPGLATFAQHASDMLLLCGRGVPERLAVAVAAGGRPVCRLDDGMADGAGEALLAGLPAMTEFAARLGLPMPGSALAGAWRAVAGSARLGFALVLPALAPAAMVQMWRRAAEHVAASAELRAALAAQAVFPGPLAEAAVLSGLPLGGGTDPAWVAALRGWMDTRLGWRAG